MVKMKMMVLLQVLGMLVFVTVAGFSQSYGYMNDWMPGAGPGWWNNGVSGNYALNSDQVTKINALRTKYSSKIAPLGNELQSLELESRGYALRTDADVNKIKEYRRKIRDLEGKIDNYQLSLRNEINTILGPDQRRNFINGGYGWWDSMRSWWSGMSGMGSTVNRRMGMGMNPYCW